MTTQFLEQSVLSAKLSHARANLSFDGTEPGQANVQKCYNSIKP